MAFDQAIADQIVSQVEEGVPLREMCRRLGVGKSTVYRWLEENAEFSGRFAQARARGFDAIAEEALEIADDGTNDWIKRQRQDGSAAEEINSEHVQRSKLRVETRLKLLAKWDPKRYGDAQLLKLGDADGNKLDLAAVIATRRQQAAEGRGGGET